MKILLKIIINIVLVVTLVTPLIGEEVVSPILEEPAAVEFTEHLGEYIPNDITLINENGEKVLFDEIIDKPTILMFVYYESQVSAHHY